MLGVAAWIQDYNSIAGVASWQLSAPARSSSTARAGMWRRRRCDQGWTNLLERAQLLTPDPRLHLLGERADLQKSVCLSMLVLSMEHKDDEIMSWKVITNAGTITSRPLSTSPDLTGICTSPPPPTTTAPSHPSIGSNNKQGSRDSGRGETGVRQARVVN